MTKLRGAVVVLCTVLSFILFGVTFAPGARADQWDKKTIVTFNESVEIPGQVLPTGTYLFKLANSPSNRHIVQIWNADQNEILYGRGIRVFALFLFQELFQPPVGEVPE